MCAEEEHMRSMVADVKLCVRGCQGVPSARLRGLLGTSEVKERTELGMSSVVADTSSAIVR